MAGIKDVDKVQRELAKVQRDIKSTLKNYKNSEGDKRTRYVEKLKDLQTRRKELDAKLEGIIGSLHQNAELETED